VLALPLVVLGLKLAANSLAAPASFAGCYGSLVPGATAPACERSFDAPCAAPSLTRYDRAVDFSPRSWQLGFVNSNRFNFFRAGAIDRERLPFRATWTGEVELAAGDRVQVRYADEGSLQVGRSVAVLPPSHKGGTVSLSPPPAAIVSRLPSGMTMVLEWARGRTPPHPRFTSRRSVPMVSAVR
jgi:hypothetical protein